MAYYRFVSRLNAEGIYGNRSTLAKSHRKWNCPVSFLAHRVESATAANHAVSMNSSRSAISFADDKKTTTTRDETAERKSVWIRKSYELNRCITITRNMYRIPRRLHSSDSLTCAVPRTRNTYPYFAAAGPTTGLEFSASRTATMWLS